MCKTSQRRPWCSKVRKSCFWMILDVYRYTMRYVYTLNWKKRKTQISRCYKPSPVILTCQVITDHHAKRCGRSGQRSILAKFRKAFAEAENRIRQDLFLQSQRLLQQFQFYPQAQPCNCRISWSFTLRQGRCCDFQSKITLESVRSWLAYIWFGALRL